MVALMICTRQLAQKTNCGFDDQVGPDVYMELVNALSPDIWASLPDEVPTTVTLKRNTLSVDRTLRWLDHCLSLRRV